MKNTVSSVFGTATGLLAALLIAGCSLAPTYERPAVSTPAAYKEAAPAASKEAVAGNTQWKTAQPSEAVARGEWWKVFDDAKLDELEQDAIDANQDLKAAAARLGQARALQKAAQADLFPQVGVGISPTRLVNSPASQGLPPNADTQPYTLWRAQATVSYEPDLFGRLTNAASAARFDAEGNAALFRSTLLALQADVAQAYFNLRELDANQAVYTTTVQLRQQTLDLFQRRFNAGDVSELELSRARTDLAAAQSQAIGVARQRAVAEHALAILLGKTPAEFSFAPQPLTRISVRVPAGLPSDLLERRPDIAAAERAMAAANARIGEARAAWFPRLLLTGSFGYEANDFGNLFKSPSQVFVLGPLVGTALTTTLFDGGAHTAEVDRTTAVYQEDVANYRQAVLRAFKEVEDNLANLRLLDDQNKAQDVATSSADKAARIARAQYREGAVAYLDVLDADRSALEQQLAAAQLDGDRARATVNLIRALGGGWGTPAPAPVAEETH